MSLFYDYIVEQPSVWKDIFNSSESLSKEFLAEYSAKKIERVFCFGSGSSHYATLISKKVMEKAFGCEVTCIVPSQYNENMFTPKGGHTDPKNCLFFMISQSGISTNTYNVIKSIQAMGAKVVTLTENFDSPVGKISDIKIPLIIGEEKIGPKTKGMTGTALTLILLALSICKDDSYKKFIEEGIQSLCENTTENLKKAETAVSELKDNLLSYNHMYSVEMNCEGAGKEGALKILETCHHPVSYYPFDEYLHGIQLAVSDGTCIILSVPSKGNNKEQAQKVASFVSENKGRAIILYNGDEHFEEVDNVTVLHLKGSDIEELADFIFLPPMQMLAAIMSQARGIDPDKRYFPNFYNMMGSKMSTNE